MNDRAVNPEELVEKARRRYPQVRDDDYFALAALLEQEIDQYREAWNKLIQEGITDSEARPQAELEEAKREAKQMVEENRILRSDREMLKDTIVRMAMRQEGVQ